MAVKRPDTRDILFESLNELLETRPFSKITVDDIVGNCGFKRGTFYYHFRDKTDLAETMIYKKLVEIHTSHYGMGTWEELLESNIQSCEKYKNILRELDREGSWMYGDFLSFIEQYIGGVIAGYLRSTSGGEMTLEMDAAISYYSAGGIRIFQKWISGEYPDSPKEIASLITLCIPDIMRKPLNANAAV